MSDVTIADVMRAYAIDAVDYAKRRFDVTLDYSERSLEDIERILADYTGSGLLVPDDLSDAEREELWMFCKMMGGYVGEVIIRNIGGEWQMKDMSGGAASIKLVSTGGVEGAPPEAIWRALTEPYKSIVSYYRGLRAILGHGNETIENGIRTIRLPPLSAQPPKQASGVRKRPWWRIW
jgi:hypothetical protein